MIGRLLDGRYQVRSRIARGGMATVYLATDLRLERRVALKVMHGHLADDSQYKARFIQEARSAARLAHPNVVNVYDQGQDDETAYLVMEYLPGITLRDLLREHEVLTADQTFDIMEAILAGLAAAHRNGIVHRDLKPENVLLADDGRIKIGDFGLARAASAATATGNALLGTIAYLSPELVTRGVADTRSDIYAVGIMLYEMLAGEQPFKGEQPFQIANQHANSTVGRPSDKNPAVPRELDELVLWSTARDPDNRPRDARVMLDHLLAVQSAFSSGTTTPLGRTMVLPRASLADTSPTAATAVQHPLFEDPPVEHTDDNSAVLERRSGKRRARGFWLFALVLLLAALAAGTGWYFNAGPGALVSIPSVSGMDVASATSTLTDADLVVSPTPATAYSTDATIAVGAVLRTDPGEGRTIKQGSQITLITNLGPEPLPVPQLSGLDETAAKAAISGARFLAADTSPTEFSATVAGGTVIRALAADGSTLDVGATYPEGSTITLLVSAGAVPNVVGKSLADATSALSAVGLTASAGNRNYSEKIPKDSVIAIHPRTAAAIVPGDTIDLELSDGPEPVSVPDVEGLTRQAAIARLENAGLLASYNPLFEPFGGAKVTGTNPEAGTSVERGTTITLYLALLG